MIEPLHTHTHTHTHTHAHAHTRTLSLSLSLTHTHTHIYIYVCMYYIVVSGWDAGFHVLCNHQSESFFVFFKKKDRLIKLIFFEGGFCLCVCVP